MRLFLLLPLGCLLITSVFSQSVNLQEMEKQMKRLKGPEKVQAKIRLSAAYLKQGHNVKALQLCQQAYSEANSLGAERLQGAALHQEAKVLVTFEDNRKVYLQQAADKLAESYQLIRRERMPKLKSDVLVMLRKIQEETEYVPSSMAKIFAHDRDNGKQGVNLFGNLKKKEALKRITDAKIQQEILTEQFDSLGTKNTQLQEMLARQDKEIEKMTQEQMRTELSLLKTRRLLDSATIRTIQDSLTLQQQAFQLQEAELSLMEQRNQRNMLFGVSGVVLLLAGGFYTRYRNTKRHNKILEEKNRIIQEEQEKSESLLLNILPAAIADELKQNGKATARKYDKATVLFTDFKNFTRISEELSPEQLVKDLDYCFRNFDRIIEKNGLEKIKTIGDAYMCAGGLPKPDGSHVTNVIKAGLEIQHFLRDWKLEKVDLDEPYFEARVGIHSGPLVAGVVGQKKFAYDVWGDTVNIASRIETSGEVGEVNISGETYGLIKDRFDCEYRGKIPVKNKGAIDMYFVRAEAS